MIDQSKYIVTEEKTGRVIKPGDTVTDFRGDTATFLALTRPPVPGKSGKVYVDCGNGWKHEYYHGVYRLVITEKAV